MIKLFWKNEPNIAKIIEAQFMQDSNVSKKFLS